jgi:hypothetical protein
MFGHKARDASWIDVAYRLELALSGLEVELRDFHRETIEPHDLRARYEERAVLVPELPDWVTDASMRRLLDATRLHEPAHEPRQRDLVEKAINASVNRLINEARKTKGLPPLGSALHRLETHWPRATG